MTNPEYQRLLRCSATQLRERLPGSGPGSDKIAALLDGLELLEPGLVHAAAWRPDSPVEDPRKSGFYAAVAAVPPVD